MTGTCDNQHALVESLKDEDIPPHGSHRGPTGAKLFSFQAVRFDASLELSASFPSAFIPVDWDCVY